MPVPTEKLIYVSQTINGLWYHVHLLAESIFTLRHALPCDNRTAHCTHVHDAHIEVPSQGCAQGKAPHDSHWLASGRLLKNFRYASSTRVGASTCG